MIHIYCGDGKGKTTAACGLALRARGAGMEVLFAQFFKSGRSSEIGMLEQCGVKVILPAAHYGRFKNMDETQKTLAAREYEALLLRIAEAAPGYGLIVLDEAVSACNHGLIKCETLVSLLKNNGAEREIVLTGRSPAPELCALADYITEMRKIKHPYEKGVTARKGIEF